MERAWVLPGRRSPRHRLPTAWPAAGCGAWRWLRGLREGGGGSGQAGPVPGPRARAGGVTPGLRGSGCDPSSANPCSGGLEVEVWGAGGSRQGAGGKRVLGQQREVTQRRRLA